MLRAPILDKAGLASTTLAAWLWQMHPVGSTKAACAPAEIQLPSTLAQACAFMDDHAIGAIDLKSDAMLRDARMPA